MRKNIKTRVMTLTALACATVIMAGSLTACGTKTKESGKEETTTVAETTGASTEMSEANKKMLEKVIDEDNKLVKVVAIAVDAKRDEQITYNNAQWIFYSLIGSGEGEYFETKFGYYNEIDKAVVDNFANMLGEDKATTELYKEAKNIEVAYNEEKSTFTVPYGELGVIDSYVVNDIKENTDGTVLLSGVTIDYDGKQGESFSVTLKNSDENTYGYRIEKIDAPAFEAQSMENVITLHRAVFDAIMDVEYEFDCYNNDKVKFFLEVLRKTGYGAGYNEDGKLGYSDYQMMKAAETLVGDTVVNKDNLPKDAKITYSEEDNGYYISDSKVDESKEVVFDYTGENDREESDGSYVLVGNMVKGEEVIGTYEIVLKSLSLYPSDFTIEDVRKVN